MTDARAIDLAAILEAEGVELRHGRGLCPLHDKNGHNPSFVVRNNRFRCWSCGESGDAIDYIRKRRGCSYPEALQLLGIDPVKPTAQEKREQDRKRRERAEAEWRERELARTLGVAIRLCHEALIGITPDTLDEHALILTELETLNYQHDIMIHGDQADRAELVRELAGLRLFKRTLLFKKKFDFRAWLRATMKKYAPPEATKGSHDEMHRASISFI